MYNSDLPNRAELPSSAKLVRSTITAAIVAVLLLIFAVLPAEYGIDPTGVGRVLGLTPMGEIKEALAHEAEAEQAKAPVAPAEQPAEPVQAPPAEATAVTPAAAAPVTTAAMSGKNDSMTIVLKPGQGAEVKLSMRKDSKVAFEWSSTGGGVNYDTHGDPPNAPKSFYHGYGKGRNETLQKGELTAAFDGKHGWFWRNRTSESVTVTIKAVGEFEKMERVI
ncbi:MAG: transmembrane anchor protein [Moraxellaceae bacterium]|nr:transmembrane anchor protein [Moraxellaceae bacterium]